MSGLEVEFSRTFFAAREAGFGPSLHSPQCSIIPAIEAIAVTVSLQIAAGNPADAPEAGPGWIAHWHENRLGEAGAAGPGPISGFGFGPPTITTTVPTFSAVTSRKFGGSTRGGRAFALVPRRRGINQRFMLSLCSNHF
jgi:hypothetical protein